MKKQYVEVQVSKKVQTLGEFIRRLIWSTTIDLNENQDSIEFVPQWEFNFNPMF